MAIVEDDDDEEEEAAAPEAAKPAAPTGGMRKMAIVEDDDDDDEAEPPLSEAARQRRALGPRGFQRSGGRQRWQDAVTQDAGRRSRTRAPPLQGKTKKDVDGAISSQFFSPEIQPEIGYR